MDNSIIPDFSTKAFHFKSLKVSSTAFQDHETIPSKYTCDGNDINPPLDIDDIPMQAKSLALIMDDPDLEAVSPKKMEIILNKTPG